AERIFPAERNQPLKGLFFNARYTLLYLVVTPFVLILPAALAAKIAAASGGSLMNADLNQWLTGNPRAWPVRNLIMPFVPMLVFDFFYYWHHRLQHALPILWEQHKLHHTEQNLCSITNLRHHWLEDGIRVFTITIPMAFLITLTPVQGGLI